MKASLKLSNIRPLLDQDALNAEINVRDWNGCWTRLLQSLRDLDDHPSISNFDFFSGGIESTQDKKFADIYEFSSTFKEIFLAFIHSDIVTLSDEMFHRLMLRHQAIHDALYLSGMNCTDAEVEKFLSANGAIDKNRGKKLCLLLSLKTEKNIVDILKPVDSGTRAMALIGMLSHTKIFHPRAHENKIKLFAYKKDISKLNPTKELVTNLTSVNFLVSYLDYDEKHSIKAQLNQLIRKFTLQQTRNTKVKEVFAGTFPKANEKPKMVILAEAFGSTHAMYRSWMPRIASLKEHFEVFLFSMEDKIDEESKRNFEHVHIINPNKIGETFIKILSLKPDMIFFPSQGMSILGLIFSNFRLAPIQVMALGHPATPVCPTMDFIIGREELYGPKAFPSDKYIIDPSPLHHQPTDYIRALDLQKPAGQAPKKSIKVGIIGSIPKLASPFFSLLEEFYDKSEFAIEYHFLTNARKLEFFTAKDAVEKRFKNSRFFGYQPYDTYFKYLREVDIVLNQFPFGNANTVVDTVLAGKPSVALDGSEPHSRTCRALLKQAGLDKMFCTDSLTAYKEKFYELANQIMEGKRDFFDPAEAYKRFYTAPESTKTFGDSMYWLYRHNKELMSSKERCFKALAGDDPKKA